MGGWERNQAGGAEAPAGGHAREAWDIASLHEEEDRRCEDVVSRKDQNIVLRMIGNKRLSPKADHLHRPRLLARMK